MNKSPVRLGRYKTHILKKVITKPRKKYRILIQERKSKGSKVDRMTSFMVYDYTGNTKIESLKEKLMRSTKR